MMNIHYRGLKMKDRHTMNFSVYKSMKIHYASLHVPQIRFHCNSLLLNFLETLVVPVSLPTNPAQFPNNYPSIKTCVYVIAPQKYPMWSSCCSGKKWKVKWSSPKSLHTSLWCCTNQSWPAVYHIRRLNASRGGPCKCVCVARTLCNRLLPQWQEMERSGSRSNQRNVLMMSVRDCAEVFSSEDNPIHMMSRKS